MSALEIIGPDYIDQLFEEYKGIVLKDGPCEANTPRQPLDETTPGTGDVSGGYPLGKTLGDYSMVKTPWNYEQQYAFTFTYAPESKQTLVTDVTGFMKLAHDAEEGDFWKLAVGEKPRYQRSVRMMKNFSFDHQYEIFEGHFKKWVDNMNKMIHRSVTGWRVYAERTKQGLLHCHAIIYSDNKYADMVCSTGRTVWAQISKGKVCAMKSAFAPVANEKSWMNYITKDVKKII